MKVWEHHADRAEVLERRLRASEAEKDQLQEKIEELESRIGTLLALSREHDELREKYVNFVKLVQRELLNAAETISEAEPDISVYED